MTEWKTRNPQLELRKTKTITYSFQDYWEVVLLKSFRWFQKRTKRTSLETQTDDENRNSGCFWSNSNGVPDVLEDQLALLAYTYQGAMVVCTDHFRFFFAWKKVPLLVLGASILTILLAGNNFLPLSVQTCL